MAEMLLKHDPSKSRPLSDFEECICSFYHLKGQTCNSNDCSKNPATKKKRGKKA